MQQSENSLETKCLIQQSDNSLEMKCLIQPVEPVLQNVYNQRIPSKQKS